MFYFLFIHHKVVVGSFAVVGGGLILTSIATAVKGFSGDTCKRDRERERGKERTAGGLSGRAYSKAGVVL